MLNRIALIFVLFFLADKIFSQEVLTVQQAIEFALKNNYDIQIAKNRLEITTLNNTVGNAGMLPRANITVTDNASLNHLDQKLANGTETKKDNVVGNSINPSFNISWTLFDGLKMFATKSKLKRLEQIGELNYKDTLQTVVAQTINAYYDVVSANQQLKAVGEAIKISEERVKVAQKQFDIGTSSKVDLLQAKVDLNEQKSAAMNQKKIIEQKRADFNRILARDAETEFTVTDSISFNYEPKLISANELDTKNFQLQTALKNVEVAKFAKKEAFSQFFPTLVANGGYGFNRTQSTAGFSLYNQTYGLNGGFALTIPIFNGVNTINQNKIAGIQILNSQFSLEKARIQTKVNFYKALKDFTNSKEVLKLEEENIQLAGENVNIALERFRLSQSTAIELRNAQKSFEDAQTRLVSARFNAKTAETELMRLQGELVK